MRLSEGWYKRDTNGVIIDVNGDVIARYEHRHDGMMNKDTDDIDVNLLSNEADIVMNN